MTIDHTTCRESSCLLSVGIFRETDSHLSMDISASDSFFPHSVHKP